MANETITANGYWIADTETPDEKITVESFDGSKVKVPNPQRNAAYCGKQPGGHYGEPGYVFYDPYESGGFVRRDYVPKERN
jgi:hypothetical protein